MNINDFAEIFKALSHPVRLKIVRGLIKKEICSVNNISQELDLPQPTVSQHLNILKNAGIITGTRKGTSICYSVNNDSVKKIIKNLNIGGK